MGGSRSGCFGRGRRPSPISTLTGPADLARGAWVLGLDVLPLVAPPSGSGTLPHHWHRGELEQIHAGQSIDWNGTDYAGTLTDDAQALSEKLQQELEELTTVKLLTADDSLCQTCINDVWRVWPAVRRRRTQPRQSRRRRGTRFFLDGQCARCTPLDGGESVSRGRG